MPATKELVMRKTLNVLRYETVLEMLEDGPVQSDEIYENLSDKFTESQIEGVLAKMGEKGYINLSNNKVQKVKGLFFNEL